MTKGLPVFIAWTSRTGRACEVAHAIGGDALGVFPGALRAKPLVPLRYLLSAGMTLVELTRRRPGAVIVTHPPVVAAAVAGLWAMAARKPFVIDAHPTAFGAKGHLASRITMPVHRFLARRASAVMVASPTWAAIAESWGAKAVVVHEAPAFDLLPVADNEVPVVVFPGIFGGDEPVDALVEAARSVDDVQLRIFGDTARASQSLWASAPANVRFTGWLHPSAYKAEMAAADVVVALTTEPGSIMRAACEAVFMGRPLVVSDSPELRAAFPDAIFTANDAASIADAIRTAVGRRDELLARAPSARVFRLNLWDTQLAELKSALRP